jgi:hypothetical protein
MISTIVLLTILGIILSIASISITIYYNNMDYWDKQCIYPEINTNNHSLGKCVTWTQCHFKYVNYTYILDSDQIMFHPNTYIIDNEFNCPKYFDLPGYIYFNHLYEDNLGYGFCEVPFDNFCDSLLHDLFLDNYNTNMNHTGHLYNHNIHNRALLDYPKHDAIGSNCPKIQDMMCETFVGTYENYIKLISLMILVITLLITCMCIVEKNKNYKKLDVSLEDSDDKKNQEDQKDTHTIL